MREELIRVLKAKINDISQKIDSLVELNKKIEDEKNKLDYASLMLSEFRDGDEYNILNFDKLTKEDYEKVLEMVDNETNKYFDANECSYEGLMYLIGGIKNGVSLNFTDEQRMGIEYLVRGIAEKEEEYEAVIDGLSLAKLRYGEEDAESLKAEKDLYNNIVNDFNDKKYIKEIDKVCDAILYNGLDSHETVNMLNYILNYNAEVYELRKNNGQPVFDVENYTKTSTSNDEDVNQTELSHQVSDRITFKPIDVESFKKNKDSEVKNEEQDEKEEVEFSFDEEEDTSKYVEDVNKTEDIPSYNEEIDDNNNEEINVDDSIKDTPLNEEITFDTPVEEYGVDGKVVNEENNGFEDIVTPSDFEEDEESVESNDSVKVEDVHEEIAPVEEQNNNDFSDVVDTDVDYEEDEKTSTRELQRLFGEYELKNIEINDELLNGNADNYKITLDTLKENDILEEVIKNKNLLTNILRYSSKDEIETVLKIVKDDLSVDKEDYKITLKIVLNTLPSIFIRENGNFDNFVKNVSFFKKIKINLISLFDFSKEVFIIDNEFAVNNYNIVNEYKVDVDYKNAKYMLVLPNIAEKMDYYVESVYEDKQKKETFDGINYINNYAVKLNSVTDLTIKRLRFSSENEKKVFGSKPYSLAGEITNLKVNVLNISDDYLNNFFNNEFDDITFDEVREFRKLVSSTSNVGNYSDELDVLKKYHKGLRYIIGNINISYNKVVRNYNILRSYGINNLKALHFAVCYNLVITKEEYQELKKTILELGGNA